MSRINASSTKCLVASDHRRAPPSSPILKLRARLTNGSAPVEEPDSLCKRSSSLPFFTPDRRDLPVHLLTCHLSVKPESYVTSSRRSQLCLPCEFLCIRAGGPPLTGPYPGSSLSGEVVAFRAGFGACSTDCLPGNAPGLSSALALLPKDSSLDTTGMGVWCSWWVWVLLADFRFCGKESLKWLPFAS